MTKLLRYVKPKEWLLAAISLVFILAQVWLELKIPEYISEITRLVQTPGSAMRDIWLTGGYMLLSALGSFLSAVIVGFYAARIGSSFARRLRSRLFSRVESFSMAEINRFSTASLITRSTNDITQVQMLIVLGLQIALRAPIMAVWAISKIAGKGFEWSLVTGVGVMVVLMMVTLLGIFVMPKFRRMQQLTDNITRVTRENLTGLRVVRAFNAEDYQAAKFNQANSDLTEVQLFTNRAMALMMPVMQTMMSGLSLAIYWIGAYLIDQAALPDKLTIFSNMVVFSNYAVQVIMSFMMLVMIFIMYPRASVSAGRINQVLTTEPAIVGGDITAGQPELAGQVEFRGVSFKYPDAAEYILQDISFLARPGETVAFIGSTGSGKSTLINLVPRFYDATEGEVLVAGVNVTDYALEGLLNTIGYVPQQAVLFKGSVASNISLGDNGREPAGEPDIRQALATAQAEEFVSRMKDGLDAPIAQGGANVSGGQKQRLAIARAIARKPDIFIFDDSFSALDYTTERKLRHQLKQSGRGATQLIVAQRIGTIIDADQIIVLDEGRIVGRGTHQELLADCAVYQEIALSQLSEQELAA